MDARRQEHSFHAAQIFTCLDGRCALSQGRMCGLYSDYARTAGERPDPHCSHATAVLQIKRIITDEHARSIEQKRNCSGYKWTGRSESVCYAECEAGCVCSVCQQLCVIGMEPEFVQGGIGGKPARECEVAGDVSVYTQFWAQLRLFCFAERQVSKEGWIFQVGKAGAVGMQNGKGFVIDEQLQTVTV